METPLKRVILLSVVMMLAACTHGLDVPLDAKNEESFRLSLAKARQSTSAEEAKQLDDALRVLAISNVSIGFEGGILGAMDRIAKNSPEVLSQDLLAQVDGKTGREVIAMAGKRRKDEAQKQLAAANAEITKLAKARSEKEGARDFLAKIAIDNPRMVMSGSGTSRMGIVDFEVRNTTEEALASLALRATVAGEDGKELFTDEFNYKPSAPIMPSEARPVRLPSSAPGKWNSPQLEKQTELKLALTVENAATPMGVKLATNFSRKDADRLALLEKQKPQLEAIVNGK
jgi:hypothetical protein